MGCLRERQERRRTLESLSRLSTRSPRQCGSGPSWKTTFQTSLPLIFNKLNLWFWKPLRPPIIGCFLRALARLLQGTLAELKQMGCKVWCWHLRMPQDNQGGGPSGVSLLPCYSSLWLQLWHMRKKEHCGCSTWSNGSMYNLSDGVGSRLHGQSGTEVKSKPR